MQGDRTRWGIWLASTTVGCLALAWPASGGLPVERPTCELDGHVLRIDPGHFDMRIVRAGDTISPRTSSGETNCGPIEPTVTNVDRVQFEDEEITLDLGGGAFAPGATDEGDGSSEIEFSVPPGFAEFAIRMGDGPQEVRAGDLPGRAHGVNLNAGEAIEVADLDVDVVFRQRLRRDLSKLTIRGQDGADRIVANGGLEFVGHFPGHLFLVGGDGDDRLRGSTVDDALVGGGGHDKLKAGRGNDLVLAKDERRDAAFCGPGFDYADVDRRDQTQGCREAPPNFGD